MTDPLFGIDRPPTILAPGAVHVPGWMGRPQQEYLLRACVDWAAEREPRSIVLPSGGRMSVRTLSLGRFWKPYKYDDDEVVPPLPDWLVRAARTGLEAAAAVDPLVSTGHSADHTSTDRTSADRNSSDRNSADRNSADRDGADHASDNYTRPAYTPDAVLVNLYGHGATMGLHQDRDEAISAPVVSLSLGDACTFRFGTPEHRGRPYTDVRLESGDLVVFGGPSRMAFHGVPKVFDGTAPAWCADVVGGPPGRVNLTLRVTRPPTLGK